MFSHIISANIKPHLSGVAKFSFLLASHLKIPCIGFLDSGKLKKNDSVFLSVSFNFANIELETEVWRFLAVAEEKNIAYTVFFHSFDDLPVEHALINGAAKIYCANEEIYDSLKYFSKPIYNLWTPALVDNGYVERKDILNIFSFSMAFKIQIRYHQFLAKQLKKMDIDYIVRFSTAFHERASFGNYDNIAKELEEAYGNRVHFFGFLSDEAVSYFIHSSDLFINFFPKGARSNNSTLFAVMKRGCPILTNIDAYSPKWFVPGKNILDIKSINHQVFQKPALQKIGKKAQKDVAMYTNWRSLVKVIKEKA